LIGASVIRPARAHGSLVRAGRTHGPDGEKALHDKLFLCGPRARVSGAHWKNHSRAHG